MGMGSCLRITRGSGYALTAMIALARVQKDGILCSASMTIHQMAETYRIPERFLVKVLQALARDGLVNAQRGNSGGVSLARPSHEISLLDILEAYEGRYVRTDCIFFPARKCEGLLCPVYCPLRKEEDIFRKRLGQMRLSDLVDELANHPNIGEETILT